MASSDSDVAQLRPKIVDNQAPFAYSDTELAVYIERYPLRDSDGISSDDPLWAPTYDLNAAAADVWAEKAAALFESIDWNADGGSFQASQRYQHAQGQERYWRSRRTATSRRTIVAPDYEVDLRDATNSN